MIAMIAVLALAAVHHHPHHCPRGYARHVHPHRVVCVRPHRGAPKPAAQPAPPSGPPAPAPPASGPPAAPTRQSEVVEEWPSNTSCELPSEQAICEQVLREIQAEVGEEELLK